MMSSPWGWSPFGGMGMGMGMGMGTISVRALCVSVCLCVQRDGAAEVFFSHTAVERRAGVQPQKGMEARRE